MSLTIVTERSKFEPDMSRGTVVVESDSGGPPFNEAFAELDGVAATNLACQFAASLGCAPAYLNGNKLGPYAVNEAGVPLDEVRGPGGRPLPQTDPLMQPARYRVDVPVTRPMR